jgi:hypothetical protein
MFLREIKPDIKELSEVLEMQSIDLEVHLGRHDKLIPPHKILNWSYLIRMPEKAMLHPFGHVLLRKAVFHELSFNEAD